MVMKLIIIIIIAVTIFLSLNLIKYFVATISYQLRS